MILEDLKLSTMVSTFNKKSNTSLVIYVFNQNTQPRSDILYMVEAQKQRIVLSKFFSILWGRLPSLEIRVEIKFKCK